MGFRFRLQRLLQLREERERQRARSLGDALRAEDEERRRVESARQRLERAGEQIQGTEAGILPAGNLRNLGLTLQAAAMDANAAEQSHRDAVDSVEEEQERFGEARQERRVIELLREKQYADWSGEVAREEQRETDGIARRRHRDEQEDR